MLGRVPALAALHVQTFNETHRGGQSGGPSYELRERQWRARSWPLTTAGSASSSRTRAASWSRSRRNAARRGAPGFAGELNKIDALRRVHRQGAGRLLLSAVARRFLDQGVTSMTLFGEAANPSNGFYEAFGAERLYSDSGEFHGGYGWRDLRVLVERCGTA